MTRKLLIRYDASLQIGSGNFQRRIILANNFSELGVDVGLVSPDFPY